MFKKRVGKPCNEAICILNFVEKRLNGDEVEEPGVDYPIHNYKYKPSGY